METVRFAYPDLLYCDGLFLQQEKRFGTHIEEQVQDGEVGDKTVTLCEYLVIRYQRSCIYGRAFGVYGFAHVYIADAGSQILRAVLRIVIYTHKSADGFAQGFVEVEKVSVFPRARIKRPEIVAVVFEERGGVVGRCYRSPVKVLPVIVVRYQHIACQGFCCCRFFYGDAQCHNSRRRCYAATVAVALFLVVAAPLGYGIVVVYLAVIRYGGEICGGEDNHIISTVLPPI